MKKIFNAVILVVALAALVGCSTTNNTGDLFNNTDDVYAFEAVSSMSLLKTMDANSSQPLNVKPNSYIFTNLGYSDEVTEEEINEINKYLGIMEQMLADDEPIAVVEEVSDRTEFTNKLVISTKDINLNVHTYTLYYNEVVLNEKIDDEETDEKEAVEKENDAEQESSLEGIMVIGDKEYTVNGKKEIEEDEMKVEFTSKIDDDNWVKVVQKTEEDETKFEYSISEAGVVSVTEMKFEKEDNETKLKLQFTQGDNENEYEFKIEEEDGEKVIKIKISDGTTNLEVKVFLVEDAETGEVTYEYRVKDSDKSFHKDREFEDDDDEEDEEETLSYNA